MVFYRLCSLTLSFSPSLLLLSLLRCRLFYSTTTNQPQQQRTNNRDTISSHSILPLHSLTISPHGSVSSHRRSREGRMVPGPDRGSAPMQQDRERRRHRLHPATTASQSRRIFDGCRRRVR